MKFNMSPFNIVLQKKMSGSHHLKLSKNICAAGIEPTYAKMFIDWTELHSVNKWVSLWAGSSLFWGGVQAPEREAGGVQ